jgi:hypothetical protein
MANYTIQYWDGDDIDLEYDDAKHTYMVGDRKIPSVTRVVDAVFPKYLVDWAATCGADYWKENYGEDNDMYNGILNAHKQISHRAQSIGLEVHKWIELYIKVKMIDGETVTEYPHEVKIPMQNFHDWVESREIEWLACEKKVYSRSWEYAGTIDALAKINGKLCVIDFKTSAKIYKEYYLQVSAYCNAIDEMMGELPKLGVIVRLDKEGEKFQEVAFDPWQHNDVFIDALNIKRFQSERIKKVKL